MAKTKNSIDYQSFKKEVEKRAYEIYQERMKKKENGDNFTDWLKAESELKLKFKF